ncbi:arylsulfatase [soil metagenome]
MKHFSYLFFAIFFGTVQAGQAQQNPNILLIYTDDLGFGDVSAYGATKIKTPNIDKLAAQGLRFTKAYATSATCTPSRFSLLTGKYAWRKDGTGIAPGDASLLIPPGTTTMPSVLQKAGYKTGVVGKWHLGLGPEGGPDWNADIKPGPLEIGFDYCFMLPSTGDRVPCVYMENYRIVDLDPADPIRVSYKEKVGTEPTGYENPELLKMNPSHGHDKPIINGISRIGYMTGGKKARWIDEDMADVLTNRGINFIETNKGEPFFLYFSTHDIHVPRVPHSRFVGKSGMGPRGDALLQLDWSVGELMKALDRMKLTENTLVIFSSDNGPVVDDGYQDNAVTKLGGHTPAGPLRGGKYSAVDAGTRVPFIVRWPGKVRPGVSEALVSQVDLLASLATLTGQNITKEEAPDSFDMMNAFLGKSQKGRDHVVEHALNGTLALVKGDWKYIEPSKGPKMNKNVNIELGNDPNPQLYNLKNDIGETKNLAQANPKLVKEMEESLKKIRDNGRSRPL